MIFPDVDSVLTIVMNAMFTGIGVAVGTYMANRYIFRNLERIEKKLNDKLKN